MLLELRLRRQQPVQRIDGIGQDLFGPTIQPGTWVHYAWTHNGTGTEGLPDVIFVNGELAVVGDLPDPSLAQAGADVTIGIENCLFPEFFRGQIDEVRVWKEVRDESEIRETINVTIESSDVGDYPDLISVFNFDGDTSDSTGTNDGIDVGGVNFLCADDQPTLFGCDATPTQVKIKPGDRDYILVDHPNGCAATITARSTNPAVLEICSIDMTSGATVDCGGTATVANRVDQLFRVKSTNFKQKESITVNVEICCVGDTTPNPPCNQNTCSTGPFLVVPVTISPNVTTDGLISSGSTGDPINTNSGELFLPDITLLDRGGPLPLAFSIYYASRLSGEGNVRDSRLGPNWSHNFSWQLAATTYAVDVTMYTGRVLRFEREPFGSEWTHVAPLDSGYSLERLGNVWELVDQRAALTYTFDNAGKLTFISDDRGNFLTLNYGAGQDAFLINVEDSSTPPRRIAFGYNGGTFTLSTASDGRFVTFTYDAEGRLASFTDAGGRATQLTYDSSAPSEARLVGLERPEGGVPFTQTFDAAGQAITQTDAFGNVYSLNYDEQTNETTITDPLFATRVHAHSDEGELIGFTDEVGNIAVFEYEAKGRRTAIVDRLGGRTEYGYHEPSGKLASVLTTDGFLTQNGFTERVTGGRTYYDLASITHPDGTQDLFVYDAQGNVVSHTDRAGEHWQRTYTSRGQVATVTEPTGGVSSYSYNGEGELTSTTNPAGDTTTLAYDFVNRPESITYADATAIAFAYDNVNLFSFTDEASEVTTFSWDKNNNLTSVTDPLGGTRSFGYDAMDRLVSRTDALGFARVATWDALGRLETVTDRNGGTEQFVYDILGRRTGLIDRAGETWTNTRDAEGVVTSVSDPLGRTTNLSNDVRGRVIELTQPGGETLGFAYDSMGRAVSATDEMGGETTITYDPRDLVAAIERPLAGVSASYERDAAGRIVCLTDPGGFEWQFGYDSSGRRVSESDPLGNQFGIEYDARSRVSRATLPGGAGTVDASYDAVGRPILYDFSDGTQLSYQRDARGRIVGGDGLSLAYDADDRVVGSNGIGVSVDPGGRIVSVTLASGKSVTYAYDARDFVTSVTDWLGGTTNFVYDAVGRLVEMKRPNGVDTDYDYDANDRVIGVRDGSHSDIALVRDARGLIVLATRDVPLSVVPALPSRTDGYDAASQLAAASYDPLGQLTSDAQRTYSWDLAGRMTQLVTQSVTVMLDYDGFDNVIRRTESAVSREYVWNYAFSLPSISIEREAGVDVRYYVHTPGGGLLYTIDAVSGSRRFLHFDELGNTLFTTDDGGQVANQYAYAPYGRIVAESTADENLFTFQGHLGVVDLADGLFMARRRVYDSLSRRFLSRDPVELFDPEGVNPYLYALANPMRYGDPTGLLPEGLDEPIIIGDQLVRRGMLQARLGPRGSSQAMRAADLQTTLFAAGQPGARNLIPAVEVADSGFAYLFGNLFGVVAPLEDVLKDDQADRDDRRRAEAGFEEFLSGEARGIVRKFRAARAAAARSTRNESEGGVAEVDADDRLVGFSAPMDSDDEWGSGEQLPITGEVSDVPKVRVGDEDLDLFNGN